MRSGAQALVIIIRHNADGFVMIDSCLSHFYIYVCVK
jgi:hypothetical protein